MDGFSASALTTLAFAIQNRAFAAADELSKHGQVHGDDTRMNPLALAIEQLGQNATELFATLESTRTISQRSQSVLQQYLTACDPTIAGLTKQLMRTSSLQSLDDMNWDYVSSHAALLRAYSHLFAYLEENLRFEDLSGQDASINAPQGRSVVESVDQAIELAAIEQSILSSEEAQPPLPPRKISSASQHPDLEVNSKRPETMILDADAPPPYEPPAQSGTSAGEVDAAVSNEKALPSIPPPSADDFDVPPPAISSSPTSSAPALHPPGAGDPTLLSPYEAHSPSISRSQSQEALPELGRSISASSSQAALSQAGSSSGSMLPSSFSSLTRSFKALTAGLRSKPDPLVSALCRATTNGDVQQMSGLLKNGANINGRDDDGHTPLQCAMKADHAAAAEFLIETGADLTNWSKLPPLFLAASLGSVEVGQMLLSRGFRVEDRNTSGQAYIVDVISSGNMAGIELLLKHGANPNTSSISGRPIIIMAAKKRNIELVKLLMQWGAHVNVTDVTGVSLLAVAAEKSDYVMADLLLDNGADPNSRTLNGSRVLCEAIGKGRAEFAMTLLHRGADPNARDIYGQPAIIQAVKDTKAPPAQKLELVQAMLQLGASPNSLEYSWSVSCVWVALETGSLELIELLLKHGGTTTVMKDDMTLLVHAIAKDETKLAHLLLKFGAPVNQADGKGRTPLAQAVTKRNVEIAEKLLLRGAMPSIAYCRDDSTALIHAVDKDDLEMAKLLLKHGADPNQMDKKGGEALLQALMRQNVEMVQLLVQHGASADIEGKPPSAELARAFGDQEVMRALGSQAGAMTLPLPSDFRRRGRKPSMGRLVKPQPGS